MLGAALIGLGYLALRSNPKKAKRRGGRPRGWKAVPRSGVRRPPGRWKKTGRRARHRDLSGRFRVERGTWVQLRRGERVSERMVSEILRDERGRQKLRPGRGRNRRNPSSRQSIRLKDGTVVQIEFHSFNAHSGQWHVVWPGANEAHRWLTSNSETPTRKRIEEVVLRLRGLQHDNPRRRGKRRRRNPVVSVKRSKDFKAIGTYDVVLSDGSTVQISRDAGSGAGGWWYVEWPHLHFVDRFIGFTKAEALAYVEEKVARLRARRK